MPRLLDLFSSYFQNFRLAFICTYSINSGTYASLFNYCLFSISIPSFFYEVHSKKDKDKRKNTKIKESSKQRFSNRFETIESSHEIRISEPNENLKQNKMHIFSQKTLSASN